MNKPATATEIMRDQYRNDVRFRQIVDYSVADAMAELRRNIDEDDIRMRDIHEVATLAAAKALKAAFDGDAEIKAAHIERDHYKMLAEQGLRFAPISMAIPKPD